MAGNLKSHRVCPDPVVLQGSRTEVKIPARDAIQLHGDQR